MSKLVEIMSRCLSPDNNIRKQGEQELNIITTQYFFDTFLELSRLITHPETSNDIRQFCGTYIKFLLSNETFLQKWCNNLTNENKTQIENKLMESLASEKQEIRKTSSMAIAAIGAIEIPKNNWNLIETICSAAINENENYRITSLITIQNILDFLEWKKLNQNYKQNILGALTTNMNTNSSKNVIKEAIKGFIKITPFLYEFIENNSQRQFIISLLNNLLNPTFINNSNIEIDTQKNILFCFIELAKYYAEKLEQEFNTIANLTFTYFNCNSEELSVFAIEFWSTVCDREKKIYNKNHITYNYQDSLSESIIRVYQNRKKFEDEDEWTPVKAVTVLIGLLVSLGNKKVEEKILNFISNCFNDEKVKNINLINGNNLLEGLIIKDNAYLAYKGILESTKLQDEMIVSSLQNIISELKNININQILGKTLAKCLSTLCKVHYQIFNNVQKNFNDFILELLNIMNIHINNKLILYNLCTVLRNLIENINPIYLTPHLTNLLKTLLQFAYAENSYNKDYNIAYDCFFIMGRIIELCENTTENKNVIQMFYSQIYNLFQESLTKNFNSEEEKFCYQNGLMCLTASCGGEYQKITMDANQIKCVFELINQCLKQRKCLFEEAIFVMGSLSFFGADLFKYIMEDVLKYVLYALNEKSNLMLCFQGLLAADDIIRNVGSKIIIVIPKILEKVQILLNDNEMPRGLKIKCFMLYTDIFLIDDKSVGDYLNDGLHLIVNSMNNSIEPPKENDDQDFLEYSNEMREKNIELLVAIYVFLMGQNQTNVLTNYMDGFIKYIDKIVKPEYKIKIDLISDICGFLGDIYPSYRGSVRMFLSKESFNIILDRLKESQNEQHKDVYEYAQEVLGDLINYFRND